MNATLEYADGELAEVDNLFVFAAESDYNYVEHDDDLEAVAHALLAADSNLVSIMLADGTFIEPAVDDYAAGYGYSSE